VFQTVISRDSNDGICVLVGVLSKTTTAIANVDELGLRFTGIVKANSFYRNCSFPLSATVV
jgi:hypothetical protein